MKIVFFTILSLIPVITLGYLVYRKDTIKEPKVLLIGLFASGFLAAFIVVITNMLILKFLPKYYLMNSYSKFSMVELFIIIFLEIALLEEFSKWVMVRIFGFKNKQFDQFYDIIIYSVFIALGFATVENIFYVVPLASIKLGLLRAFIAVPAHAAFGVFMGYFFAMAKYSDNKFRYFISMISAFLIPAFFHTIYDFCMLLGNNLYLIIFILFISALYISAIVEINSAIKKDKDEEVEIL